MDGSSEHQGYFKLSQMPDSHLREMLERQERLKASGVLDRTSDVGARARALIEKLRDLLRQREGVCEAPATPIEDRSPQTRRFLPSRRLPPPQPLPPPPPPPISAESPHVEELSQAVAALNITNPAGPTEALDPPGLLQAEWAALRARLVPCRPRPALPRQQLLPAARLALLDLLPDPARPSRLLQVAALPLSPPADPVLLFCRPAFLSAAAARQTGLSLRPDGALWLEGRPVEAVAEAEALAALWAALGDGQGDLLLLLPSPPGCRWPGLSLLGGAAENAAGRLLLELGRTEWRAQISSLLTALPQPLNCTQRLAAVHNFLSEEPQRLSALRLAEASRVVRLEDRLALAEWLRDRARRLADFRRRLPANAGLLSPEEAEQLATEGWDLNSLLRAAAAGWDGFACALLGPWDDQPAPTGRLQLARRLFCRLRAKFERVEQHRESLLPRDAPLVALITQGDLRERTAVPLTLRESVALTEKMQQPEGKKTESSLSMYAQPQFTERREMDKEDDDDDEEEEEGNEDESSSNDGEKDECLSDAD